MLSRRLSSRRRSKSVGKHESTGSAQSGLNLGATRSSQSGLDLGATRSSLSGQDQVKRSSSKKSKSGPNKSASTSRLPSTTCEYYKTVVVCTCRSLRIKTVILMIFLIRRQDFIKFNL